ncbi:hypothetical protein [Fusobacterium sp.]|uniref:hypothetical protein n=1 Tax=Fusobacterium sp. TaxID=68766 RepID=UPI0028FED746|nr:hypothetical protein [Fusobacterium sp.]MDU1912182.1 hypothetical protein [Fusobacterium sp.]
MKKTILGMFCLLSAVSFAGDFDREEHILAGEIYKNFPVLEAGKKIIIKEIDVDIEDDKAVEVDVEFAVGSEVNIENYDAYAKQICEEINKNIKTVLGDEFKLIRLELDTSGIKNDKKIYRY